MVEGKKRKEKESMRLERTQQKKRTFTLETHFIPGTWGKAWYTRFAGTHFQNNNALLLLQNTLTPKYSGRAIPLPEDIAKQQHTWPWSRNARHFFPSKTHWVKYPGRGIEQFLCRKTLAEQNALGPTYVVHSMFSTGKCVFFFFAWQVCFLNWQRGRKTPNTGAVQKCGFFFSSRKG